MIIIYILLGYSYGSVTTFYFLPYNVSNVSLQDQQMIADLWWKNCQVLALKEKPGGTIRPYVVRGPKKSPTAWGFFFWRVGAIEFEDVSSPKFQSVLQVNE